ncbi:rCG20617 [Rattus norvegicus]|uniref:RCG20617 n=1 Tax=Rattus norvegicus TaxID=10116 RepID=A6JDM1_RAT|nr:rCG20617 [Rattus norvegicus]
MSQLTWTLEGFQRLNHQPKIDPGPDLALLHICSRCAVKTNLKKLKRGIPLLQKFSIKHKQECHG